MGSTELVPVNHTDLEIAAVAERTRFAPVMSLQVAMQRREAVKEAFSNLMEDGHDYGKVAGIGKPTLLQPGAQKLDNLFGLVGRYEIVERDEDWTGERHGGEPFFRYLVRCQLMRGEFVMGEAIGECNSFESKYRWRTAERKCPTCGVAAIIKTKKNTFWCAPFKQGCGAGFSLNDPKIANQETGRKPNPEIFDQVNTLLKMAQKRAHVAATINATSASEFFTQDVEDRAPDEDAIDTNGHKPGTAEARDAVRDRKVEEAQQAQALSRPVPKELQFALEEIDKDATAIAPQFSKMENRMIEKGGANGVTEYQRIVKAFREKFPKGSEKKRDLKECLLDLWDSLQTLTHPVVDQEIGI